MNLTDKIYFIYEQKFVELNEWQKVFIGDLYVHVGDGEEELTEKQKRKVEEIWQELS